MPWRCGFGFKFGFVRFVRFLKYGELQKKICFLRKGGFLIKICMYVKKLLYLLKNKSRVLAIKITWRD